MKAREALEYFTNSDFQSEMKRQWTDSGYDSEFRMEQEDYYKSLVLQYYPTWAEEIFEED